MPDLFDTVTEEPVTEAEPQKVFKCYYCKKPYNVCQCYERCEKCDCIYRKTNPCNSKKCTGTI